jgi:4-methyl-5(b-hydroxyethyl)-thiazole monophosphate biosynthesis
LTRFGGLKKYTKIEEFGMPPKVLVPIADGTEEIEAVCIIDVLRRAGADVTVASVGRALQVTASRGVKIVADAPLEQCRDKTYDLIVLPGGMPGAEHLRDSRVLEELLKRQQSEDRWYAAICAAPAVVLQPQGLLQGKRATGHPAFMEQLDAARAETERVVVDGRCITSRGPGTALEFALKLVEHLFGSSKAEEVAGPMIVAGR